MLFSARALNVVFGYLKPGTIGVRTIISILQSCPGFSYIAFPFLLKINVLGELLFMCMAALIKCQCAAAENDKYHDHWSLSPSIFSSSCSMLFYLFLSFFYHKCTRESRDDREVWILNPVQCTQYTILNHDQWSCTFLYPCWLIAKPFSSYHGSKNHLFWQGFLAQALLHSPQALHTIFLRFYLSNFTFCVFLQLYLCFDLPCFPTLATPLCRKPEAAGRSHNRRRTPHRCFPGSADHDWSCCCEYGAQ